jgi:type IX secretion system substrate protein
MKKNYFFIFLAILLISLKVNSQTYSSAQNGNWMNPTTWSPIGIPIPGSTVFIGHNVVLDTSFIASGTLFVIQSNGSLINDGYGRDLWINGASFNNQGTVSLKNLLFTSGSFTNNSVFNVKSISNSDIMLNTPNGTINGVDSLVNFGIIDNKGVINISTFYNDSIIYNYGAIQGQTTVVDSIWSNGVFVNFSGALLKADSCTSSGYFYNEGAVELSQLTTIDTCENKGSFTFDDITNYGVFINEGTMTGSNSMWNVEEFDNRSTGVITLTTSFLNADSAASGAIFNNDGSFDIGDSFYNFNDITGGSTGSFTMQDTSYNSGTMTGSFDFCDATPAPISPYVDINLGTVDPLITFCSTVGINETDLSDFIIYPNPTTDLINIGNANQYIEIYNIEGRKVIDKYSNQVNLEKYQSGIYYLIIKDDSGRQVFKEKIIKN